MKNEFQIKVFKSKSFFDHAMHICLGKPRLVKVYLKLNYEIHSPEKLDPNMIIDFPIIEMCRVIIKTVYRTN